MQRPLFYPNLEFFNSKIMHFIHTVYKMEKSRNSQIPNLNLYEITIGYSLVLKKESWVFQFPNALL